MAICNSIIPSKICTRCRREFPATSQYWAREKIGKYGFRSQCKECCAAKYIEKQIAKGKTVRPKRSNGNMKQCSKCDVWLPATIKYFKPVSHHKDGLSSHCLNCIREANKAYQTVRRQNPDVVIREHQYDVGYRARPEVRRHKSEYGKMHRSLPEIKEQRRQYSRQYEQKTDRRLSRRSRSGLTRAKRRCAEGKYTKQDIIVQLNSQKGLCWWCGKPHGDNYEIDHRIPLARGGTNWPNNLCITCRECNRSKHNKLPHEFNGRLL